MTIRPPVNLEEIEARALAATPNMAPTDVWEIDREEDGDFEESPSDLMRVTKIGLLAIEGHDYDYDYSGGECRDDQIAMIEADCTFVAHARADVLALVPEVRALREALTVITEESTDDGAVACARAALGLPSLGDEELEDLVAARAGTPPATSPREARLVRAFGRILCAKGEESYEESEAMWQEAEEVIAECAEAELAAPPPDTSADGDGFKQRVDRFDGGSIVYAPTVEQMEAALVALAPNDYPVAHLGNWSVCRCTCGSPRAGGLRCPGCGSTFDAYEREKRERRADPSGEG